MKNDEIDNLIGLYKVFNKQSLASRSLTEILLESQDHQPAQRVSSEQFQKMQETALRRPQQTQQQFSHQKLDQQRIQSSSQQHLAQHHTSMPAEAQLSSNYLQQQLDRLVNNKHSYEPRTTSGTVTAEKFVESEDKFDLSSKRLKKIKNDQSLFDQEKLNPESAIWTAVASMLLEQNNVDEFVALNARIKYSDKINHSYEKEFGRVLLDDSNEQVRRLRDFVNSPEFPEYYRYGYHDIEDKNHELPINREFLEIFVKQIVRDQYNHGVDIQPHNIKESSNKYVSETSDKEIRRTEPFVRKSGQMYASTNDPDFEIQAFFSTPKRPKSR